MKFKERTGILTDRELKIIELIAGGFKDKEISEQLGITTQYIRSNLVNGILKKTGTNNRPQLITWAFKEGLLS